MAKTREAANGLQVISVVDDSVTAANESHLAELYVFFAHEHGVAEAIGNLPDRGV